MQPTRKELHCKAIANCFSLTDLYRLTFLQDFLTSFVLSQIWLLLKTWCWDLRWQNSSTSQSSLMLSCKLCWPKSFFWTRWYFWQEWRNKTSVRTRWENSTLAIFSARVSSCAHSLPFSTRVYVTKVCCCLSRTSPRFAHKVCFICQQQSLCYSSNGQRDWILQPFVVSTDSLHWQFGQSNSKSWLSLCFWNKHVQTKGTSPTNFERNM